MIPSLYRHDVSQIAGLTAISFGVEDVDRYIVVYKKDQLPSENEVCARRNGEEWNKETAEKYAQKVTFIFKCNFSTNNSNFSIIFPMNLQKVEEQQMEKLRQMKPSEIKPNSNYKDKYVHLIGQDAAVKAAKKTETNKSYGFGKRSNINILAKKYVSLINVCHFLFSAERKQTRYADYRRCSG